MQAERTIRDTPLAETRPVEMSIFEDHVWLSRARHFEAVRRMLPDMHLGLFETQPSVYHFGLLGEHIPDHSRWVYAVHAVENIGAVVYRIEDEGIKDPKRLYDAEKGFLDRLAFEMEALLQITEQLNRCHGTAVDPAAMFAFARMTAMPTYHNGDDAHWDPVRGVASLHELHDLVQHPARWTAHHPEATGLPRELVLRMHGFGAFLDDRERHRFGWLEG
jgi:hypothetical protein